MPNFERNNPVNFLALPAFSDNYIWTVLNSHFAIVVDPGDSRPVFNFLEKHQCQLLAILITHNHNDHTGGILELASQTNAVVYGSRQEMLPRCDVFLSEGDTVQIPELGVSIKVLEVPGHTAGHIAYYGSTLCRKKILFCGDTLFSYGCGRLLEGTSAQMVTSLQKLAALPNTTEVYPAHEYTLHNLEWALAVEPNNHSLRQKYLYVCQQRKKGLPTLPSSIGHEKLFNPFLRIESVDIMRSAGNWAKRNPANPTEVFTILRKWKDVFK